MTEELKLNGSIFGYDTLIKEGDNIIALRGKGVPELYKGMNVILLGDSRGYVPSRFNPGEEATIIEFTEPFKQGESDHVIQVSSSRNTGWVKPSNIQKNVSDFETTDYKYQKIRRSVH